MTAQSADECGYRELSKRGVRIATSNPEFYDCADVQEGIFNSPSFTALVDAEIARTITTDTPVWWPRWMKDEHERDFKFLSGDRW